MVAGGLEGRLLSFPPGEGNCLVWGLLPSDGLPGVECTLEVPRSPPTERLSSCRLSEFEPSLTRSTGDEEMDEILDEFLLDNTDGETVWTRHSPLVWRISNK